ncbi:hypothetical protein Vafri_14183 [Volvox africanus]|uniref:VWFA domain-containing protein n=1 Tax=Volvox africanus TaxID=51714 RepID=A0A8J4BDW2_9CHLO|nr:hypothetical protein Vafri_14183 [Volvox africanus]
MTASSWTGGRLVPSVHKVLWLALFLQAIAFQRLAWGESVSVLKSGGFVCLSMDVAEQLCTAEDNNYCGRLYIDMIKNALAMAPSDANGILAFGQFQPNSGARKALELWLNLAGYDKSIITYANDTSKFRSYSLNTYKLVYIPSGDYATSGGITGMMSDALQEMKSAFTNYVNVRGGSLIALAEPIRNEYRYAYGFLPVSMEVTVNYDKEDWITSGTVTKEMSIYSPTTTSSSLNERSWLGYFTGPTDWNGLRVVAHVPDSCPVPQGKYQNCHATVLCNIQALLTSEDCYNGVDDDNDGSIDKEDDDCKRCGDGTIDPSEGCDDGNILDGDGCTSTCQLPPPLPPRPPAPPSPFVPSTMTVKSQYLKASVVFKGSSPYSWCDAPAQDDLVTQLAAALKLARDNVTATCKGQPGAESAQAGHRRLLQDDNQDGGDSTPACGSDGGAVYDVKIQVDPTVIMYDFKAKAHDAMMKHLSGICPLGDIDGSWANTGYVMTNSGAVATGEKEKSGKSGVARKTIPIVVTVVGVGLVGLVVGITAYVYKKRKGSLYQAGDSGSVIEEPNAVNNNNGPIDKSLVITNGIFATNSGGSTGTAVPGSTGR